MPNLIKSSQPSFQWSSQNVFILVMIGAILSIKDFLVFPVISVEHGGGAYILLYALFMLILGFPVLLAELLIGRQASGNLYSNVRCIGKKGCSKRWQWIVTLSLLSSLLVLSIYNVIAGWSLSFVFKSAFGVFALEKESDIIALISAFQSDPERMMLWHSLFVMLIVLISAQGLKLGLKRAFVILVPLMFILLFIGIVYAILYGDYAAAVQSFLIPDFSKLDVSVAIIAMQNAFYTLSVGLGIFLVFGSKLPPSIPLVYSGFIVVIIDIIFSVFVGLAINALILTTDVVPNIADELGFSLLPLLFANLPSGQHFGTLFYILLIIASITSAVALLEVLINYLGQKFKMSRIRATVYAALLTWFIGVLMIFSYTIWAQVEFSIKIEVADDAFRLVNEAGIQDILIFIASHFLQPFTALLMVLFVAYAIKKEELAQFLNIQSNVAMSLVQFIIRYITPTLMFIILISAFHYA